MCLLQAIYVPKRTDKQMLLYLTAQPLFAFGHGLSYTTFEYNNLAFSEDEITINDLRNGKTAEVSVRVRNTVKIRGAEVVQMYIKDLEASITTRNRELKGFKKIWLDPGEEKTLLFTLGQEELSVWNVDMQFIVEPGNIRIMVGGNSIQTQQVSMKILSEGDIG